MSDIRDVLISLIYGNSEKIGTHPQTCSDNIVVNGATDERLSPRLDRLREAFVYQGHFNTYEDLISADLEDLQEGDVYKILQTCKDYDGNIINAGDCLYYDGEGTWINICGKVESAMVYKGEVDSYSDLPTDADIGDVYKIITACVNPITGEKIQAGDTLYWNGTEWIDLIGKYDETEIRAAMQEMFNDMETIEAELTEKVEDVQIDLQAHIEDKNNPHEVTAAQLGLASAYVYKGSLDSYADLPDDASVGDVYNITEADEEYGIKAGDNVAWTGESWDNLSGTIDVSSIEQEIKDVDDKLTESATELEGKISEVEDTLKDGLVADVDYADKVMTVTKGDGTSKNYTIDTCDCPNMIVDISLEGETLTFTFKDGESKSYIIPNIQEVQPPEPIVPANGTLTISGDLDGDLIVNGNVEVSGNISGNVTASGTITYGTLSGTVKENATLTECDIQVDNGTCTIGADASVSGGKIVTTGQVTNEAETVLYCDMDVDYSGVNAVYNYSKLTVEGKLTAIADNYAVRCNDDDCEVIVNGSVSATATSTSGRGIDSGTWTVYGSVSATATGSSGYGISGGTWTVNGGGVNAEGGGYGIYNSTWTISANATVTANSTSSYGVFITSSSEFTVSGTLTANGSYGVYMTGGSMNVTSTGKITANGTSTSGGYGYRMNGSSATTTCDGIIYGYCYSDDRAVSMNSGELTGTGSIYANDTLYWQNGSYV